MGIKPSVGDGGTNSGINRHIGSAYDDVRTVADNIDVIKEIAGNFDVFGKYVGAHTSAPTTRADGSPLQDGDFYLNTTSDDFWYYDLAEKKWIVSSLDPSYVEDLVRRAETARDEAVAAETNAKNSETLAGTSATNANVSAINAKNSETNSSNFASSSQVSATASAQSSAEAVAAQAAARTSETNAKTSETNAGTSETNAATSETNAGTSETNAKTSETNAATSETNAANSEINAAGSATRSNEWAEQPEDVPVTPGNFSALHWAEKARKAALSAIASGGVFTPTAGTGYPTPPDLNVDTLYFVGFDNASDNYTFTSGDLIGKTAYNTDQLFYDAPAGTWDLIPSPSANAIIQINGKSGSTVTLISADIPHTDKDGASTNISVELIQQENDIATLVTTTSTLDGRITTVDSRVTQTNADVTALTTRVSTNESDIQDIKDGSIGIGNADTVDNFHAADLVQIVNAQTITGVKTFGSLPLIPTTAPTAAAQAVSKSYSDSITDALDTRVTTLEGTDIVLTFTGDATGTGSITNLGDVSVAMTVTDNSHSHVIDNVTGLQPALDGKANSSNQVITNAGSGLKGGTTIGSDPELSIDIKGTPVVTSSLGSDVVLIETNAGLKSISRDDLLSSVSGGITLRGEANPVTPGLSTVPVTGDSLNNQLTQGTAPTTPVGGVPNGYTYIVQLQPSDQTNGITINLGGTLGNPITFTVFDQDQLIWLDDEWAHLETGDAVISVFGRNGAITAQAGDYTATQITAATHGAISDTTVQGQLEQVENNKPDSFGTETISGDWAFSNLIRVPEYATGTYPSGINQAGIIYDPTLHQFLGIRNGVWELLGSGSGGGLPDYQVVNSNTNLATESGYLFDVSGGPLQGLLPAGSVGDWLATGIYGDATNQVTLIPNGSQKINGGSSFALSHDNMVATWFYVDDTRGWVAVYGINEKPRVVRTKLEESHNAGTTPTINVTYDVGYVDVFVNGSVLASADYTATNGSSITLSAALKVNSIIQVLAYSHMDVLDITASQVTTTDGTVQSDINTVKGDITTIEGEINTIQGTIITIQDDITTLESDMTFFNNTAELTGEPA